jgi:AraC-like DNA-binding protein
MLNRVFYAKNPFLKSILLLLLIAGLHILAIVLNSGAPLALLYGPLLYYAHLSLMQYRPNKTILFFLFFPFLSFFVWYFFLKTKFTLFEHMLESYYLFYFIVMVLSLSIFPICVLIQKMKWASPVSYLKSVMIQQLSVICLIISLFIASLFMEKHFGLQFDVPVFYIILMLLVLSFGILLRYIYQELVWEHQIKERSEPVKEPHLPPKTYSLPLELLEDYAIRLRRSLDEDKLYLRPDLSVELLAQETEIPRHHLSELFNAYLGKSFYQLIAVYRIKNAIELLKETGDALTIEALAYESGFNSKTSFNKYFKQITGFLPSEFRNQQSG